MNRSFVLAAVPKPAYWRIVQSLPRYMVGYTPRVYGGWPGAPNWAAASHPARSEASYNAFTSMPESVRFSSLT